MNVGGCLQSMEGIRAKGGRHIEDGVGSERVDKWVVSGNNGGQCVIDGHYS
jgi:hypothetical protein